MTRSLQTKTLDELIDHHIGIDGSPEREVFEYELRMDLLGDEIRRIRKQKRLSQSQLGKLVGVQKAQISKIENSLSDARLETILKVFKALKAKISFRVEWEE